MNELFKTHLQNYSLDGLRSVCKSDLHNHFGKGGSREYIESIADIRIDSPPETFETVYQMDEWFRENIKIYCPYIRRLEAGFVQAASDNISVLAASFGFNEENMTAFIETMKSFNQQFAPNTIFLPELALGRNCDTDRELSRLVFLCLEVYNKIKELYYFDKTT